MAGLPWNDVDCLVLNVEIFFVHNNFLKFLVFEFNSDGIVEVDLDLLGLVSEFFLVVQMADVKYVPVLIFLDDLGHCFEELFGLGDDS